MNQHRHGTGLTGWIGGHVRCDKASGYESEVFDAMLALNLLVIVRQDFKIP